MNRTDAMFWEKLPYWAEKVLQGISFWMGYKTQLFYNYPLTEGAIVGEVISLINGNLTDGFSLNCEVMYKKLNTQIDSQERADLVIYFKDKLHTIIEVKRAKASNQKISDDLLRLARCHKVNPSVRCFLVIVSQKFRPSSYVNDTGKAVTKEINGDGFVAKVRRATKAAASFEKKNTAFYSCIIEVKSK